MTRWLDDDEKATWRLYIAATRLVEDALDRQLREDSGMPHSYYEILVRLSAAPERSIPMSELAERTLSSRSRLSHAVGRLEELGWVTRQPDPDDGRRASAVLTEEGQAALADAAPGHVEEVRRRIFDPLTPEQTSALHDICSAMLRDLDEDPDSLASDTD